MECMDFQKQYDRFIFVDDFLNEVVDSRFKLFYIAWF
jgi:hypothetical protein